MERKRESEWVRYVPLLLGSCLPPDPLLLRLSLELLEVRAVRPELVKGRHFGRGRHAARLVAGMVPSLEQSEASKEKKV